MYFLHRQAKHSRTENLHPLGETASAGVLMTAIKETQLLNFYVNGFLNLRHNIA